MSIDKQPIDKKELQYSILTEDDLETLKSLKNVLVKGQMYAEAAHLRDLEKRMMNLLEAQKELGIPTDAVIARRRKEFNEGNLYSHKQLLELIELATTPLKNSLKSYEDSIRTLIDKYLAKLIKENHELRVRHEEEMIEFGTFVNSGGQFPHLFNPKKVYAEYLAYKQLPSGKKKEEPKWVAMDGVNEIIIGETKFRVRCEHDGCAEMFGREYKRVSTGASTDKDPIFLCDQHSSGFEPYST